MYESLTTGDHTRPMINHEAMNILRKAARGWLLTHITSCRRFLDIFPRSVTILSVAQVIILSLITRKDTSPTSLNTLKKIFLCTKIIEVKCPLLSTLWKSSIFTDFFKVKDITVNWTIQSKAADQRYMFIKCEYTSVRVTATRKTIESLFMHA